MLSGRTGRPGECARDDDGPFVSATLTPVKHVGISSTGAKAR
ncbi:hypothetical protein C791_2013 [Amycolatopsis azurea DSM 43854]|uniref:Uncharacterized protein n=1 Tax=Amycolatopsis azurea DSM 43854 TaxID=1238180 RepID=M2QPG2_9PSEU|nr:hypothetical protein C791_2013 [Amycolatopsis azurea DSM 43854]